MSFAIAEQMRPARATGRYTMREVRSVTESEWDGWLADSPGGGHIYQTYAWGEFKRRLGWKPVRLVLERDGQVVGLGQFLVWSTPFVPGRLMYATKGPWLPWEDELAVRTFFLGVRTVAARENAHTVKIEPEVAEQQAAVKAVLTDIGFRKARWDLNFKTTMFVDISPSEEELLANMKGKTRYNIRLAENKGVEVVEDNSLEAREHFFEMLKVTAERDGFSIRRPREYQMAVWQSMYDRDRANLYFATHEGDRLAGFLAYTFGKKYWYHLGASTNEKRNLMAPYLLQWEVMRRMKARGMTYYDMGPVPSPDNLNEDDPMWGVYRFKVGFDGQIADFLGSLDLPVGKARAAAWHSLEPAYYRAYQRLRHDIYY